MKNFLKKYDKILLLTSLLTIATVYSIISVLSHNHFQTFGWDLGFFDQIIWKASQGDLLAYSTIARENLLADHFQVVLYFLAPLYWIKSDISTILIVQAFLVTLAAFPLYLMAKGVTKNIVFSLGITFAYLFFLGTQWTILNEFHQAAFIPIFLSLVFYFLHTNNLTGYWLGILGLLITKEELGFLVAAIGLVVWLRYKMRNIGILTSIVGLFTFFFLIYWLMPAIATQGAYRHVDYGEAGYMPVDVIFKIATEPLFFFRSMVYPTVKLETVAKSFFAFGFLPIMSPVYLIPVLENFMSRFIYAGPQFTKWANVNHQAAPLGALLSIATIYAGGNLAKVFSKKYKIKKTLLFSLLGIYLIGVSLLQDLLLHGPINSIFKPQLYETLPWMRDNYAIEAIASKLPPNVPIAAQNSMVPHLSQREKIYLLPEIGDAQFIVVDLYNGSNKYAPLQHYEMVKLVESLVDEGKFAVAKKQGQALLLKRVIK